jgi:hypothetical protein
MNLKTKYTQRFQGSSDIRDELIEIMCLEFRKEMDRKIFQELGFDYEYYQFNEIL